MLDQVNGTWSPLALSRSNAGCTGSHFILTAGRSSNHNSGTMSYSTVGWTERTVEATAATKNNGVDLQDRVERVFEKIVTPTKTGVLNISPLEIIASGLTIGLLLWFHDAAISSKVPLLIPPFAGSIGVLYTQPGMTQARSWNVIAGQFFGGLAGFICASIFTGSLPLAAGFAISLALLFQRSTHSLHPPALATALIVVIIPESHGVRYLFFPILLGAVIIVVIAWIVHLFEFTALAHLKRMVSPPGVAAEASSSKEIL